MYNFWGKQIDGEYYREHRETWKLFLKHNHNVVVYVFINNKL